MFWALLFCLTALLSPWLLHVFWISVLVISFGLVYVGWRFVFWPLPGFNIPPHAHGSPTQRSPVHYTISLYFCQRLFLKIAHLLEVTQWNSHSMNFWTVKFMALQHLHIIIFHLFSWHQVIHSSMSYALIPYWFLSKNGYWIWRTGTAQYSLFLRQVPTVDPTWNYNEFSDQSVTKI